MLKCLAILLVFFIATSYQWNIVNQSKGGVWPLPQSQQTSQQFFTLDGQAFQFWYNGTACQILDDAFERYLELIFEPSRGPRVRGHGSNAIVKHDNYRGQLQALHVHLDGQCETWPHYDMQEIYDLDISVSGDARLLSSSVWGLLRGLETFSHLAYYDSENNIIMNATWITDYPRFRHRGVMLETSGHYVNKSIVLKNLDAMSYAKYNVFHWHIVDDSSFPYQSKAFPELSDKGAYDAETHIYSMNDVVEVIDYARQRGIRVIVEFDTPSHVASWGPGMPGLLTQCYANQSGIPVPNGYGPIDPSLNSTYEFLQNFLAEVLRLFPDDHLHIGGNDVSYDCWKSNKDIQDFMISQGYGNDYDLLWNYYTQNLLRIVSNKQRNVIVWEDVFEGGVDLDRETTIIQVRKNTSVAALQNITSNGYRALLSSCWILSDFKMANDWITFYPCEPTAFNGTEEQSELVVGGEACLWSDYVDATNLVTRLWPRALAPAERLWSNHTIHDHNLALPRFEEHRCRMVRRGINAEPVNGPSFCPSDYLF